MKQSNFAVVGAGHIGKRHAEMVLRNEQANLIAICDIANEDTLNLNPFNVPFYNSLEEMLNSHPEIEILCVATPNGLHAKHALIGLEARKHVIVEKPMALSKADCESIIYKAMSVHKHVFCVMQNRYSPPSVWIKDLIKSKTLGKIHIVQINCYWNRDDRYYKKGNWKGTQNLDGGTLFTQFSHFIDIMYWLFGDISNIKSQFSDFTHSNLTEFEDSGIVSFKFKNGGLGCLNYSTAVWDQNFESSITVIAENGTIKIGGQYMNEVEYCHVKDYTMPVLPPANPANDYGAYKGSAANHNYIFDNVIDCITKGKTPTTNALEGLKVVEIIENIYANNSFFKSKQKKQHTILA